jgi:D-glycero-alpha-D-manno-heptose-7-phosphate kinase
MIIRARAPLRLGLAGGGTDTTPYCDEHCGYVLNATIGRYAYATLTTLDSPIVRFMATDQQVEEVLSVADAASLCSNGVLDLHKAVYRRLIQRFNKGKAIPLELSTFCDAPAGSGLGSSSTLVVAMIRALAELLKVTLDDYTIAQLAFQIERVDCELLGGRQDQYSATFGGFNFMEFYADDRAVVNTLRIDSHIVSELEASLLLCFTGTSRESSKIISDQIGNIIERNQHTLQAMHEIKQEALVMKECLLKGNFDGIVESMRNGWESKKRSAKTVTNTRIDEMFEIAIDAGALAGKVSGAGGGGYIMFFVPLANRMNVIRAIKLLDGEVSNCHFTKHGLQSWRVS